MTEVHGRKLRGRARHRRCPLSNSQPLRSTIPRCGNLSKPSSPDWHCREEPVAETSPNRHVAVVRDGPLTNPRGAIMPHAELHYVHRTGWLRASVLGANDGLISTASLVVGVAAAASGRGEILTAAFAGWAAGAMAMAAGEFVSVSSQADSEAADLAREKQALKEEPEEEYTELAQIYVDRGLDPALARRVAEQLMAKDALSAHARDELGFSDDAGADPLLAAAASALSFPWARPCRRWSRSWPPWRRLSRPFRLRRCSSSSRWARLAAGSGARP